MHHQNNRVFHIFLTVLVVLSLGWTSSPSFAQQAQIAHPWTGVTDDPAPLVYVAPSLADVKSSEALVRVVVRLDDAPVTQYDGSISGYAAPAGSAGGKIDINSTTAVQYRTYLQQKQAVITREIMRSVPSAEVQYSYQLGFNGLTVRLPGKAIRSLETMPGVTGVYAVQRHELNMDASLQLIGLLNGPVGTGMDQGLWKALGGHENAGKDIKIAVIDTGIDINSPYFNPAGFHYPQGFPKGDPAYTTPKVIAARVYIRPDAPANPAVDCNCARDYLGHGSHTSGTMAGVYGTNTGFPYQTQISGIAPAAWLMSYKIFYHNIVDNGEYSETPEELMAIDDMIADGADLVNNSWGGTAIEYPDPTIMALDAAMDAGIVVVFSAGNSGPSANSIGNPGNGARFITVGNSTTNRLFAQVVNVTGGDASVTGLQAVAGSGPHLQTDITAPYVDSTALGNTTGCSAGGGFPANSATGKILLISRGTCTFSEKVINAQAAGAIAVTMVNNAAGLPISMSVPGTSIPSVMVSDTNGLALRSWLVANPGAVMTITASLGRFTNPAWEDQISSSSSKGPGPAGVIKPDLTAPGTNILSAVAGGYELYSGTSMAAPHVTGVAALVKQMHHDWTPDQIKSAIVNTAQLPASLDSSCRDILGFPYPGPMCRGAGRLYAGDYGPGDPGLLFNKPTVSLGTVYPDSTIPLEINATNVGPAQAYTVTVEQSVSDPTNVTINYPASPIQFTADAVHPITLEFVLGAGAVRQDYYGMIHVDGADGKHKLSIPYWFRVVNALPDAEVLLIDDDSSNTRGYPDVRQYYTDALTALGISYTVFETDTWNTCDSPWNLAPKYPLAILFTGDSVGYQYYCDFGTSAPNLSGMNNYLAAGGKLLLTGRRYAYYQALGNGRNSDLGLWFGASYVTQNVYGGTNTPPAPSAVGMADYNPFLNNVKVDFSATTGIGAGAANQTATNEVNATFYSDTDMLPLFRAVSTSALSQGLVGTRASSEPTIERIRQNPGTLYTPLGYRTELLTFGLEGVNDNTGYTTRSALLNLLLNWLKDEVSVEGAFDAGQVAVSVVANLNASASSSLGAQIDYYRFDFGDGNFPVVTGSSHAYHKYSQPGTYEAWVEAVDIYGHKAVDGPIQITVTRYPYSYYLPFFANP